MRKGRTLAGVLAVTMVLGSLTLPESMKFYSFGVDAQAAETVDSGTCGDNLTWVLDDEGTLTISGTGEMTDFAVFNWPEWISYKDDIISVVIEDGVTSISQLSFTDCTNLTSVYIAGSVTTIDDGGTNMSLATTYGAFKGCTSLTTVVFSEGLEYIGSNAFSNCTSLTSVEMPDSLRTIEADAFYNCTGLTNLVLNEGLTTIEYGAFSYCSITELTIPSTVTELSTYLDDAGVGYIGAFQGCTELNSLIIEDGVSYIGADTFADCTGLTSVTIPSSVKVIGMFAFDGCTNLSSVTISEGVEEIRASAFYDCTSLKSLTIPASVTYIQILQGEARNAVGFYYDRDTVGDTGEKIVDGFVIYGYTGTEAETYANETGITFIALDKIALGDVNLDGSIDYLDAMTALRYDAELIDLSDAQLSIGDVNNDGSVNSLDAILILRYDAGLIESFE